MGEHNCYKSDAQVCIQKRAYELWAKDGCKPDRAQDYWLLAEKSVRTLVKPNKKPVKISEG